MSKKLSEIIVLAMALGCGACDPDERPSRQDGEVAPGPQQDGGAGMSDLSDADGVDHEDAADTLDAGAAMGASADATSPDAECAPCAATDAQAGDGTTPREPDAGVEYVPIPNPAPLSGGDGAVLPFRVADAEYSDALQRIVIVTSPPNRLILLDPETFSVAEMGLPLTPTSLSLAPDGLTAAVGHNGHVSIVTLPTLQVLHTHPIAIHPSDVVLAGNGYVYAFPRSNGWGELHSIRTDSGAETTSGLIYGGAVGRLHPAGDRLYGADRGISPADIERYDIGQGTGTVAYDSPYHGDHEMCGDLWIAQDGARIFTACGNVFRASNTREEDMLYGGSLEGAASVRHLDHSSAAQLVATVHGNPRVYVPNAPSLRELAIYEDRFLNQRRRVTLPSFRAGGKLYISQGRFVFFNAEGTRLYVLLQAEAAAPMINNEGLARFTLAAASGAAGVIDVREDIPAPPASGTPSAGLSLGFRVIDAEYSRPLDRIVAVSQAPALLSIVDPSSAASSAVPLPLTPIAVSLHPGGRQAAVAHDGWLSIVDLDRRSVTHTLPVSAPLADVVLGSSGHAYGFPSREQWVALHSVRIVDAQETRSSLLAAGTLARLHPAGDRLYAGTKRFEVASGPATFAYEAPYDGVHTTCGNNWFSEDGLRIFTPCGNVFRASNIRAEDMTYLGTLQGSVEGSASIAHLDYSRAAARLAVAIRPAYGATGGTGTALFDAQSLTRLRSQVGPNLTLSGTSYPTNSRFVFFNAAGSKLYVVSDTAAAPSATSSILTELVP